MTKDTFDQRFYWLWTRELLGVGSSKVLEVLDYFKSPKAVFDASEAALISSGLFSTSELSRRNKIVNKKLLDILKYSDQNNIRIVTYFDDEYPECLRRILNPPILLFVRGADIRTLFPTIAIVGSRKPTEFGKKAAFSLAARLSLSGFTVVSGGALGVDKMAHLGALSSGGKTIVVLGSGIDSDYLKTNEKIRKAAELSGAVISEFEPKAAATRFSFPIRNRIISALSSGVAVIEAGQKSGALITASYAMEQGREIFAVPGDINKEEYKGNNQLIKDGATPITSYEDIISVYSGRFGDILKSDVKLTKAVTSVLYKELENEKSKPILTKNPTREKNLQKEDKSFKTPSVEDLNCSENAKKLLSSFSEKVLTVDALSAKSGLDGGMFSAAVFELELKGYIKAVPVGRYRITLE